MFSLTFRGSIPPTLQHRRLHRWLKVPVKDGVRFVTPLVSPSEVLSGYSARTPPSRLTMFRVERRDGDRGSFYGMSSLVC